MTVKAVCIRYVILEFTYFIVLHMYFMKILVNFCITTIFYSAHSILHCILSNTENIKIFFSSV
jgi:hypothetical protein